MKRLFGHLSTRTRISAMLVAMIVGVLLSAAMGGAMQSATDDSAYGIVDFELAGSPERATEILDDWGSDGRDGAERAIKLDYGFLIAYSALLALATSWVASISDRRGWVRTARAGWRLAFFSLLAGILDAIENTALLTVLNGYETQNVSQTATLIADSAAAFKFAIVAVAVIFVAVVTAAVIVQRFRPATNG